MRSIGVVTVGRSDFGLYRPILRRIRSSPDVQLQLFVSGAHLLPEFGGTVDAIESEGFEIAARVDMLSSSDAPDAIAAGVGRGTIGFAHVFDERRPDILLLLGDRIEMLAPAVAALPSRIPIAHIHGGEATEGAIDDTIRHALTKLSHLHFVATEAYGARVIQMGEEPWRVTVSGAPGLDNVAALAVPTLGELEARVGIDLSRPYLLVTFHPVTLEQERTGEFVDELLAALASVEYGLVFTYPNADSGSRLIIERVRRFVNGRPRTVFLEDLGTDAYFGLMRHATAMVGNSSSGIIEAASFMLPVVNVGSRQRGRIRGANVVDVECDRRSIRAAIRRAGSAEFREALAGLVNPYGDGRAAARIVNVLASVALDTLMPKRFHDLSGTQMASCMSSGVGP